MARPKSVNLSKLVQSGSCISRTRSSFIHWDKTDNKRKYDISRDQDLEQYDIVCVGPCVQDNTWPKYLEKEMDVTCGNFSVNGIDHFTVVHNARYVLENYKTDTLILYLGPYDFLLPKRYRIDDYYEINKNKIDKFKKVKYERYADDFDSGKNREKINDDVCKILVDEGKKINESIG